MCRQEQTIDLLERMFKGFWCKERTVGTGEGEDKNRNEQDLTKSKDGRKAVMILTSGVSLAEFALLDPRVYLRLGLK